MFYWRKQGDDPLQRALDLAERKRVAVFSKIYNVSGKYYIVQVRVPADRVSVSVRAHARCMRAQ